MQAAAKVWLRAGAKGIAIASHRAEDVEKSSDELEQLRKELGAETQILAATVDLVHESHAEDLFARAKETFGRPPDVVMANAGFCPKPKPLHKGDVDDWWHGFVSGYRFLTSRCSGGTKSADIHSRRSTSRSHITLCAASSEARINPKAPLVLLSAQAPVWRDWYQQDCQHTALRNLRSSDIWNSYIQVGCHKYQQ